MARHGTADLPLHSGSAPRWLFDRMTELGGAIAELVVREHGREAFLERLADPYWFQAFGCVLGFDWHSSGVTTTTMGALKEAIDPAELGVAVVGGKGGTSRKTPGEIDDTPLGISGGQRRDLVETSRLSATVDNACVQDGFELYHHTMAIAESGEWCVVQQGMNDSVARRYHWLSSHVDEVVVEPQSAICSQRDAAGVLDLSAATSESTREVSVDLINDDPSHLKEHLRDPAQTDLTRFDGGRRSSAPPLSLPARHELRLADLSERSIDQLEAAYEYQPADYEELLTVDGVGPKSLRALALIGELVYDAEASREDPAKYAYAHGGKDGTPHPVDRERYDRSIREIRNALEGAAVDDETTQSGLDRLRELTSATAPP